MTKNAKDLQPLDNIITTEGKLLTVWAPVKCQGGQIVAKVRHQGKFHTCYFLPCEPVTVLEEG
jgi:hypothetical protein